MLKYFTRRILWIIPVFLGITLITSAFMKLLPGSPFTSETLPPAARARIEAAYGLDKPFHEQYITYVANFVRGDWGVSFKQNRDVTLIVAEKVGYSVGLAVVGIITIMLFGITLGIVAALNHNKFLDYLCTGIALFIYSIPSFVLAILVLIFLVFASSNWGWQVKIAPTAPQFGDLILPGVILGIRPASIVMRLTRASMLEVLSQDYIRTAWSKGLSQRLMITRHALKNALIPIITVLGDEFGQLAVGSVTIEAVFNIPGIGGTLVQSVQNRDYPLVLITVVLYAIIVVFVNLIVDMLYGLVDPRIKYTTRRVG
jgi:ABC-type dipeptide/oligopeptide/nickel transport system permease component